MIAVSALTSTLNRR